MKKKFMPSRRFQENDIEKATFRNMVFITYCITFTAAFAALFLQFDSLDWETISFSFGCAKKLSPALYILATICQAIVPTTITFAGSVLILQSLAGQTTVGKRSLLFVSIVVLAIVNVAQNAVQSAGYLLVSSIIAIILSGVTLFFSKNTFSLELDTSTVGRKTKSEESDCRPCA